MVEDIKREKAKNLRYKKPIVRDFNLESMKNKVFDIMDECDIFYDCFYEENAGEIIEAMAGDEDDAQEFRMAFSVLSSDCYNFLNDIADINISEDIFNALLVTSDIESYGGNIFGYDSFEGDYLPIDCSYAAKEAANKRLMALTKGDIISYSQFIIRIMLDYVSINNRYDSLKASLDILKNQNLDLYKAVNDINRVYDDLQKVYSLDYKKMHSRMLEFDNLTSQLPYTAWIA